MGIAERCDELEDFVYRVSHDLREPLRVLQIYSGMLQAECKGRIDPDSEKKLAALARLSNDLDRRIEALLRYSRLGRHPLRREPIPVARALADATPELEKLPGWSEARVRVDPEPTTLVGDRGLVGELLVALVSNGILFNDRSTPVVEIAGDPEGNNACVVRDDGIGVDPRHREDVFQMFRRLHARDEYGGGIGAGLALARRIVERHGGSIELTDAAGGGTAVRFDLGPEAVDG